MATTAIARWATNSSPLVRVIEDVLIQGQTAGSCPRATGHSNTSAGDLQRRRPSRRLATVQWSDLYRVPGISAYAAQTLHRIKANKVPMWNRAAGNRSCPHPHCSTGPQDKGMVQHVFWTCATAQRAWVICSRGGRSSASTLAVNPSGGHSACCYPTLQPRLEPDLLEPRHTRPRCRHMPERALPNGLLVVESYGCHHLSLHLARASASLRQ